MQNKTNKSRFDARNIFPEIIDEIQIIGNISQILNQKQFEYLKKNYRIKELGYDGETTYITFQDLFTIQDIKDKINEICKGVE